MADGFSFSIVTKPVVDALADKQRRMDRAAMWAVRETGRAARAGAKAATPVYKGGMTQKAFRAGGTRFNAPVRGLLRASIKPSRTIAAGSGVYRLTVGPRGARVRLYAAKIEARAGYMAAGQAAALAAAPAVWARAVEKVMT